MTPPLIYWSAGVVMTPEEFVEKIKNPGYILYVENQEQLEYFQGLLFIFELRNPIVIWDGKFRAEQLTHFHTFDYNHYYYSRC